MLADCEGLVAFGHDASYAGTELALIRRGARTLGPAPANGVSEAQVAGKKIQLAFGCGDGTGQKALSEARRLVDQLGSNVLIGPTLDGEALALKEYANRRSATTFIEGPSTAQSLTLHDPAPNVFRFSFDGAQLSAGLGAYAYRTLGWRTAVTVGHDEGAFVLGGGFEYTQAAGFVAEFCALGGRIIKRVWSAPREVSAYVAGDRADGFFVADPGDFETEFGALRGSLAKRIVGGYWWGPPFSSEVQPRLAGVVTGGWLGQPPTESTQTAWRDYLAAMQSAFPGLDAQMVSPIVYYVDMEAVIEALEQVHGDLSGGERRFQAALANVRLNSPVGPIQLDQNRQAVGTNYLGQFQRSPDGTVTYRTIRVVPNVDERFGGYFHTNGPLPSESYPPCRRGDPPSWARSG